MISELITLGSFVVTTIQKGPRAGLRGAATDFVKYTIVLGAIEKVTEYGVKKYKKNHGKKRI
jgi:hypothetical protein